MKERNRHIKHYKKLSGHPGGRKLYYRIISSRVLWYGLTFPTFWKCGHGCNRIKLCKNVTQLQLFPETAPLKSVFIDILGELIRTQRKNEYFLVIMDRYTKTTKTVPKKRIAAAEVAKHFVNSWVFNFSPPEELIAEHGGCSTSKYFQEVFPIMNVHNSFTKAYHPQANRQGER